MKAPVKLFALLWLCCLNAWAIPEDDAQEMVIHADSFHFNNQTGLATYTGNVVAEQGSRLLKGDKLEIHRNAQGGIDKVTVYGDLAHYQGLTDLNKPLLYAEAKIIDYQKATDYLILIDQAQVEQDGEIYRAARIERDGMNDTVYSPPSERGQTTIVLKQNTDGRSTAAPLQ